MKYSLALLFLLTGLASPALAQSTVRLRQVQQQETKAQEASPATQEAKPVGPADTRSSRALYEEANGYARKRFEDFIKRRIAYDKNLEERTWKEQREMAERHAALIGGRANPTGEDLYYMGLLYQLAEQEDAALDALRRFLAEQPSKSGEHAQGARLNLASLATRRGQLDEAEKAIAEFAANHPQRPDQRFRAEVEIAVAYQKIKRLDRAAQHAEEALKSLKFAQPKGEELTAYRDGMDTATSFLINLYLEMKKTEEAVKVLEEMRRLALALPAPSLYRKANAVLAALGRPFEMPKRAEGAAAHAVAAPELSVAEWIDQQPVNLQDLKGQVVLLDFWAPWCGPCIKTFPILSNWHTKYKDRGLVILGLTHFEDASQAERRRLTPAEELSYLRRFKAQHSLPYGVAVASTGDNDLKYGVYSLPTAFLIDRRGTVRHIAIGYNQQEAEKLGAMNETLIREQ